MPSDIDIKMLSSMIKTLEKRVKELEDKTKEQKIKELIKKTIKEEVKTVNAF